MPCHKSLNPRRKKVIANRKGSECPSCNRVKASSWRRIVALNDDEWYCNPCYHHYKRYDTLPDLTELMMSPISIKRELPVVEELDHEPCPECGITSSTCWLRIKVRGEDRYCVDCYLRLHRKRYPKTSKTVPIKKPNKKYPPKPSKTGDPCPWCVTQTSGKWQRIRQIGDGKQYCNTCSTNFIVRKKLKPEHENRFAVAS